MAGSAGHGVAVDVGGRQLTLSNLDKVLYPACGFTKRQVIDYYVRIAPVLLPHLHGRPLTMKRYPEGVEGGHFFEKNCPSHRPHWVRTAPIWSADRSRRIAFCLVEDVASLVWAANLADLELHTSLATARDFDRPTMLVFDLDPGAPADVIDCCRVALRLRTLFDWFGLETFPKTSGSKGLQIYLPLNTPVEYEGPRGTKAFAHAVARLLEEERPREVVSQMKKTLRAGKVLVDWSQNTATKTTVCVYSLRARDRPTVSTPLAWDEVEHAARRRNAASITFESDEVLRRVGRAGDLFAPVLTLKQKLPRL